MPICDHVNGCGTRELDDGATCGSERDDPTYRCRALTCTHEPQWDPSLACDVDSAPAAMPRWSIELPTGRVGSKLVVDSLGQLRWFECSDAGCALAGATPSGQRLPTFPGVITGKSVRYDAQLSAIGERLVVSGSFYSQIRVLRAADGSPIWDATPPGAIARFDASSIVAITPDPDEEVAPGADSFRGFLTRLDLASGAQIERRNSGVAWAIASSGDGDLAVVSSANTLDRLVLFSNGQGQWSTSAEYFRQPLVVGEVVQSEDRAFDRASGALRYLLGTTMGRIVTDGSTAFASITAYGPNGSQNHLNLVAFRWADGTPLGGCRMKANTLFATSRNSVLALANTSPGTYALREVDVTGAVTYSRTLDGIGWIRDALIAGDLLVVSSSGPATSPTARIAAYPLPPGLTLAPHGWVMEGGNPQRDFTPR